MAAKISGKKILVICVMAFGALVFGRSLQKYLDMKSQRDAIRDEIEQLKEDNARLQQKISNIYNDREYVEKVAREQLNLVKDGETVYIITRE